MRHIIANFDAEIEMAREATPGPHPSLPSHVRRHLTRASAALAALDPSASVHLGATDLDDEAPEILAWAQTTSIATLEAALERANPSPTPAVTLGDRGWIEALWSLRCQPAIARRCHDRRFWLELATARDSALPETHLVSSRVELEARLPAVISHSAEGAWIAKAPLSASGRERVYRWGATFPADAATRLDRLFERYGELVLEPFMARVHDVGVCGVVSDDGALLLEPHRLQCDDAGVFRGIDLTGLELDREAETSIRDAAHAAGDALHRAGYRGAFGIDAFLYRTPSGAIATHPIGEINARLTFGHVAHAASTAPDSGA